MTIRFYASDIIDCSQNKPSSAQKNGKLKADPDFVTWTCYAQQIWATPAHYTGKDRRQMRGQKNITQWPDGET